jgi:SAM-dependent methyltransferase
MPPEALNFRQRAQLTELMDEPCSREVMRDCLRDLARVNRWFLAHRPLLTWLDEIRGSIETEPIRILDVGCGYGDTLRRVERWARDRGVKVELTGLDMNPDSIAIAAEAGEAGTGINWIATDVFAFSPAHRFHLIVSCQFMHHLGDGDVIRFVRWMEENAEIGWFINDLSRAPIPYHLFRVFSRVAGLHPFVQNDGPVSIARAFVTDDWRRLCAAAGLRDHAVEIRSYKPARLCVSRRKAE